SFRDRKACNKRCSRDSLVRFIYPHAFHYRYRSAEAPYIIHTGATAHVAWTLPFSGSIAATRKTGSQPRARARRSLPSAETTNRCSSSFRPLALLADAVVAPGTPPKTSKPDALATADGARRSLLGVFELVHRLFGPIGVEDLHGMAPTEAGAAGKRRRQPECTGVQITSFH